MCPEKCTFLYSSAFHTPPNMQGSLRINPTLSAVYTLTGKILQMQNIFVWLLLCMTVAINLSPCSARGNWWAKNRPPFSTDVDEILVHVCTHWGRLDNVHANVPGEAFIPVFTPPFRPRSLFPARQRQSGIGYWRRSQLSSQIVIKKNEKTPTKQQQKPTKKPTRDWGSIKLSQLHWKPWEHV